MSGKFKKILIVCLCFGIFGGLGEFFSPSVKVEKEKVLAEESVSAASGLPSVSAQGAVLIDAEDGRVLYRKEADKRLYPASTTKIMTALVALEIMDEIGAGLDSFVVVPEEAVGAEGSSVYLKKGEKITLRELMYGMMLQSGNDAALAVAICCGGDMETFVSMMNKKAADLGCTDTHFVNPNGLYDKEHYTTAEDLAKISMEAMKRDDFRKIVGAADWQNDKGDRGFHNKNKTITQYKGATGIKIGFTKASGRTLCASAQRGERELIAVVLNAPDWFNDAYALMDYGFEMKYDE